MDSANLQVEKQQEATRKARTLQLPKKGGKLGAKLWTEPLGNRVISIFCGQKPCTRII